MKHNTSELSRRYLAGLRSHLSSRRPSGRPVAQMLGRDAVAAGLDILDLARMHEQALVVLAPSHDFANARNGQIKRTSGFFTAALVPMEKDNRATRENARQLKQHIETLRVHTAALAASNRHLQREVRHRKAAEESHSQGKELYRRLYTQSQGMQKKLRGLARQILAAQEAERRTISRDLHDDVVQKLVAINVQLAALDKAADIGSRTLRAKIAQTKRIVQTSVEAVHQFARELRPSTLDDLGLIPALHDHVKIVSAKSRLKINLTVFAGVETLDIRRRTVLYRVVQEALINVTRHARASLVKVSLNAIPRAVRLEVHDNGKSFQVEQTLSAKTNRRLGLLGMRERVEMVGGTLSIESAPDRGTTVRAEIPLPEKGVRQTAA